MCKSAASNSPKRISRFPISMLIMPMAVAYSGRLAMVDWYGFGGCAAGGFLLAPDMLFSTNERAPNR